jgi:hypothetical protein
VGYAGCAVQLVIPPPNRSFGSTDALGLVGLAGLLVARFVPLATMIPFWGCGLRRLTGIPCPGCGLTRVAERVAHFNVAGALHANPLGTVAAVFFGLMVVVSALHLLLGMPVPELRFEAREWRWVRRVAVGVFALNYGWVVYSYTSLGYR